MVSRRDSHGLASTSDGPSLGTGRRCRAALPKHFIPPGAINSFCSAKQAVYKLGPQELAFSNKLVETIFAQRKHRLELQAQCTAFRKRLAAEQEATGLLSLPDDLLARHSSSLAASQCKINCACSDKVILFGVLAICRSRLCAP